MWIKVTEDFLPVKFSKIVHLTILVDQNCLEDAASNEASSECIDVFCWDNASLASELEYSSQLKLRSTKWLFKKPQIK